MKNAKHLTGAIAMMAMMGSFGQPMSRFEEDEFEQKEVKKVIPKGCKEFTYKGITVIALSEKRAINKIEKLLKKLESL